MNVFSGMAAAAIAVSLSACAPMPAATPPVPSLPAADVGGANAILSTDETLQVVDFAQVGSTTVSGEVVGYTSASYAVPVAAGQTLTVNFASPSPNLNFNVHDTAIQTGEAVHRGEFDGPTATLTAPRDMTYLIRPFQPRATARRNESGSYTITISRN